MSIPQIKHLPCNIPSQGHWWAVLRSCCLPPAAARPGPCSAAQWGPTPCRPQTGCAHPQGWPHTGCPGPQEGSGHGKQDEHSLVLHSRSSSQRGTAGREGGTLSRTLLLSLGCRQGEQLLEGDKQCPHSAQPSLGLKGFGQRVLCCALCLREQ